MSDKATTTPPAGIAIEDVPAWVLDWEKIAHAVARSDGAWCWTACGSMMTGSVRPKPGKRGVCRACRERLKTAILSPR